MSRDVITVTRDDMHKADGKIVDADFSISFGLNGQWYDIDLTEEHDSEIEKALERFIAVARKVEHGHPKWPTRQDLAALEAKEREKQYLIRLFDWALSHDDPDAPKYRGGFAKKAVRERYDSWLAEHHGG